MTPVNCEACILAGGRSARMGRDKARLELAGKTLLGHARSAARQAGLPVRLIRKDLIPGRGPVSGVYTALRTTKREAVLFLACDMPFVTPELLHKVLRALKRAPAVFVCSKSPGFPFAMRAETLAQVERYLAGEDWSLRGLAAHLRARQIVVRGPERTILRNLNTPEDYAQARSSV